jgi:hypothetical protein
LARRRSDGMRLLSPAAELSRRSCSFNATLRGDKSTLKSCAAGTRLLVRSNPGRGELGINNLHELQEALRPAFVTSSGCRSAFTPPTSGGGSS